MGAALCIGGCTHTETGLAQDAKADSVIGAKDASEAMGSAAKAGRHIGADLNVTMPIKLAFAGDTAISASGNAVHVKTTKDHVILTGSVDSERTKELATQEANKVLADHDAVQTLTNDLEVRGSH